MHFVYISKLCKYFACKLNPLKVFVAFPGTLLTSKEVKHFFSKLWVGFCVELSVMSVGCAVSIPIANWQPWCDLLTDFSLVMLNNGEAIPVCPTCTDGSHRSTNLFASVFCNQPRIKVSMVVTGACGTFAAAPLKVALGLQLSITR